jgi:hypothetical protein
MAPAPPAFFRAIPDLINEALANLGVLAAGQNVDPEDYNYVSTKLPSIFLKLQALEIIAISPMATAVPGYAFSDLADIVAGECCTKFGSNPDQYVMLVNRGLGGAQGIDVGFGAAAKSLRAMVRGMPTGEVLQVDYF